MVRVLLECALDGCARGVSTCPARDYALAMRASSDASPVRARPTSDTTRLPRRRRSTASTGRRSAQHAPLRRDPRRRAAEYLTSACRASSRWPRRCATEAKWGSTSGSVGKRCDACRNMSSASACWPASMSARPYMPSVSLLAVDCVATGSSASSAFRTSLGSPRSSAASSHTWPSAAYTPGISLNLSAARPSVITARSRLPVRKYAGRRQSSAPACSDRAHRAR